MKVAIDFEGVKRLLSVARQGGTVDNWIALALDWMKQAEVKITELEEEKKKEANNL